MPSFSNVSQARLATCRPELQSLFNEVVKEFDCSILCGHRDKQDQEAAVAAGKSKTPWPTSKHNKTPSMAVDAAPYPIDFKNRERIVLFAGFVLGKASSMGIKIRWGGDWNRDWDSVHERFSDLVHFELINE